MGKRPKLEELDSLLENKTELLLTDGEYAERTGVPLPQKKKYIMEESALSRYLHEKGYEIVDIRYELIIQRTLHIRKN